MDCLRVLGAAALLCMGMVAGCDFKSLQIWPATPPGLGASKTPDEVPPRPEDLEAEAPKKLKPETLLTYARLKEQAAANPEVSQVDRERLREAARQAYLRALDIDPKFVPAHVGLANWFDMAGNHAKALATYEQVVKLAPKDKMVWQELGMCHARHKDWDPAIDSLRKASELDPDDRQIAKTLGLCLARAGRYDDSLACLEKVVGKAEAHCTVARMLHHLKQDDASKREVQLALESDPNLAEARALLDELEDRIPADTASVTPQVPAIP
jgi:tetratricopeptide (TPR) repeat protein